MKTAHAASFDEWRSAARGMLAQGIAPHDIRWGGQPVDDLFGSMDADGGVVTAVEATETTEAGGAPVPRRLLSMLETAACYRDPDRWAFLYKVLWRWHAGDHVVVSPADEDGARLHAMVKTVQREIHKMNAFLRFRERSADRGAPRFVAWFEPQHDVLEPVARHFTRRMGKASWLIATPQGTAMWDGNSLRTGPPAMFGALDADRDIADDGEALWLAYYRSTFNPARLNTGAMEMHMPVRYWKNLPEGKLIPGLISQAGAGAQRIAQTAAVGERGGKTVRIDAVRAQPERQQPTSLDQCRRCELWRNATQAIPGTGPVNARIVLVGEQPGDQEDIAGVPFVGPAGKLLDTAFAQAGLDRQSTYLTNAVKHFKWEPRGKRRLHKTPAQLEVDACSYWLDHELAEVGPVVVVALGSTALKAVLKDRKATLTGRLGQAIAHEGKWIVPTWHPSYVLRVPGEEAKTAAFAELVEALQLARRLADEVESE
jgi:DNA polymerase